ncbi:MAG: hypothetical protein COV66_03610 [Nitrospinae bacterium CG11_big_fil_rev_8_21_14_0_20_45_15]|nr:MAG: hypothetical protein COV66_03610 [Nitrospinae bacterium CG11_big_fil_rev_8_21_14_0_20_45_15]
MKNEYEAVLLRIFIGESDEYEGQPLYQFLVEFFKKEEIAGVTVLRGIAGYGNHSEIHTTSILRLSSNLPIVVEAVDKPENIAKVKLKLEDVMNGGMVTEERVKITRYDAGTN